jgi:hypothetical protein
LIKEKFLPSTMMYELTASRDVSRRVDIDIDGELYWDSVAACKDPGEMIGRNSLVEGPFKEEAHWPQSDTCIYEKMTQEAFDLWFDRAQRFGRRRTHAELSRMIMGRAEQHNKE